MKTSFVIDVLDLCLSVFIRGYLVHCFRQGLGGGAVHVFAQDIDGVDDTGNGGVYRAGGKALYFTRRAALYEHHQFIDPCTNAVYSNNGVGTGFELGGVGFVHQHGAK